MDRFPLPSDEIFDSDDKLLFHDQVRPTRLDVETIRHAILSYGFTPTWLGFTVQADLTAHEGRAALRVPDTWQLIWLVENPRLDALQKALTGRTARAVIAALIPEGEREGIAITSFSLIGK